MVLRREIPMAWGTTTDSLTPKINPFQYAIEIKYLTLKDQTLYLTPNGQAREENKIYDGVLPSGVLPSGVAYYVTERNSYGLGYHNRQLDSRNQSFPICNRN